MRAPDERKWDFSETQSYRRCLVLLQTAFTQFATTES